MRRKAVFREIAQLTKGALPVRSGSSSSASLAELLKAVAVYATGGLTALAGRTDAGAIKLWTQLSGNTPLR